MRPDAEMPAVYYGAPAVATALLALAIVVMLAVTPGTTQTATLVVAIVVQAVVMVARAWPFSTRRATNWSTRWHQFAFIWGATGAFVFVTGADRSTHAALVALGQQLAVAAFVVGILWLVERGQHRSSR